MGQRWHSAIYPREVEQKSRSLWTREITSQRNPRAALSALMPKLFGFDERFGLIKDTLINQRLRAAYGTQTFADTQTPLYVVATNFNNGEKTVIEDGLLFDALRASISIPFVFPPWPVDGQLMMDGFMSDPMPVDVAIREGADIIIALGFDSPYQREVSSAVRYAFQITTMTANNLLSSNFAFHNLAHHEEILIILPEFDEHIRAFDTTKLPQVIAAGEAAMQAQIPYLQQLLGGTKRLTGD